MKERRRRSKELKALGASLPSRLHSSYMNDSCLVHEVNVLTCGDLSTRLLRSLILPILSIFISSGTLLVIALTAPDSTPTVPIHLSAAQRVLDVAMISIFLIFLAGAAYWTARGSIFSSFALALATIDRYKIRGFTTKTQRALNRRIIGLARQILVEQRRTLVRNSQVLLEATQKADGVLELQTWVSMPLDSSTYEQLRMRLKNDAASYLKDGWHALPNAEFQLPLWASRKRSFRDAFPWVLLAFLGAATVAGSVSFSNRLGVAAAGYVSLLGLVLVVLGLVRAGVPLAQAKEGIGVLKDARDVMKPS